MIGCLDCGRALDQQAEKAVGSGEVQMVWADPTGSWECDRTGNEHRHADLTPFEVEFTQIVHVLAPDEDAALKVAEPFAVERANDGAWSNYDECVRTVTDAEF